MTGQVTANGVPLSLNSRGQTLAGTAHLVGGSLRGAVLLQGWGGTRYGPQRILVEASRSLAACGISCVRIDFRGRGDSQGDPAATTLDGMIEDALAAADWLKTEQGVQRFTFLGLCSGANVSLGAASLRLAETEAVVAWSLLPFMEHKQQVYGRKSKTKSALLRRYLRKMVTVEAWKKLLAGRANVSGAMQTLKQDKEGADEEKQRKTSQRDILADFQGFAGRCFLVYGTRDPEAADSAAFFQRWFADRHIEHEVRWITGAPHNFYTAEWTRQVIDVTVAWLTGSRQQGAVSPAPR